VAAVAALHPGIVQEQVDKGIIHVPARAGIGVHVDDRLDAADHLGDLDDDVRVRVVAQAAAAENMLTGALKSLFAVAEAYPDLKANTNFLELQRELSDTENKIQAARRFYNTNVRDLNIKTDSFPSNLVAKIFKFGPMEFFDLDEGEATAKEPVKVKF